MGVVSLAMVQLAAASPGSLASPGATWLAPDETSHAEGPYGVLFQPRYSDPRTAHTEAARDVASLMQAREQMDDAARAVATLRARDRLMAVQTWKHTFTESMETLDESLLARPAVADAWFLLSAEEATLELQLQLMGEPNPRAPALTNSMALADDTEHEDLVSFGESVHVGPGMTVRDAISFGGDVLIEGRVLSDAVSFGGDVFVEPSAVVLGDAVAFGGAVRIEDTAHVGRRHLSFQSPADAFSARGTSELSPARPWSQARGLMVSWLSVTGAGLLTLGLFPAQVDHVASTLTRRPMASGALGFVGVVGAILGAALFAITIIGIPVSLLLLASLGMGGLMGFVAICQVVGDQLPFDQHHGRWLAFIAATLVLTLITALPTIGVLATAAVLFSGVGASFLARFGRA